MDTYLYNEDYILDNKENTKNPQNRVKIILDKIKLNNNYEISAIIR